MFYESKSVLTSTPALLIAGVKFEEESKKRELFHEKGFERSFSAYGLLK